MSVSKQKAMISALAGVLVIISGLFQLLVIAPSHPDIDTLSQVLAYVQVICGPAFFFLAYKFLRAEK